MQATEPSDAEVAHRLLLYLRAKLGSGLSYAEPPSRITGGYETRIYSFRLGGASEALTAPLILRVFSPFALPEQARFESAVQNAIAEQGYPAPRVLLHESSGDALGTPFLVMQRLPGVAMHELLRRPSPRLSGVLAEAQARLHALDAGRLRAALEREGVSLDVTTVDFVIDSLAQRVQQAHLAGLEPGLDWIRQQRPAAGEPVVCHGDFHPNNLLVDGTAVSGVLDWSLVKLAPNEFDVGNTRAILFNAPRNVPSILDGIAGFFIHNLARRYTAAYRRLRPLDGDALRYYEALRCLQSLVWAGEHRHWAAQGVDLGPNPWAGAREAKRLLAHFRRNTGIAPAIPSAPGSTERR